MGDLFGTASDVISRGNTIFQSVRLVNGIISGLANNGENSPLNGESNQVPYIGFTNTNSLGKQDAIFVKTRFHVGKRTSNRI